MTSLTETPDDAPTDTESAKDWGKYGFFLAMALIVFTAAQDVAGTVYRPMKNLVKNLAGSAQEQAEDDDGFRVV